ncbi:hypothetical protein [Streptomyces zagrosensis]|uniref:Lipoprotein n=1 Tax=Streptomyces zagrosensis TaxID=1042984 RepID=A0A7W9QAT7_9ACTN|nr:hypothetical protein [Streptomyces zagrosensis]MBB5936775.1 hypothetical protein [Streptomyces zagrosensis]
MRTWNTALVAAVCAGLAAATLAGCGGGSEKKKDPDEGTNGVGKLPADKIEAKARQVAQRAGAVRLTGNVVSKGRTYSLDMRLKGDGGTGQVSTKGSTFQLLRVDKELYLKAGADFWSHQQGEPGEKNTSAPTSEGGQGADRAAASKLEGKYVKVPAGDPSYKQLSGFTDKTLLLDGLLGLHGTITSGDRAHVAGVPTIRITGDQGNGGTLDVSLRGTPYPVRLQRAGGAGVIQLADWNKEFALSAPKKGEMVDYGQQLPQNG